MDGFAGCWKPTRKELQEEYFKYFSLSWLDTTMYEKFVLISLICFLTKVARKKKPEASCYQVIQKCLGETAYDEDFIFGLSAICEDFMIRDTSFATYGCKSANEMMERIKGIIGTYLPF